MKRRQRRPVLDISNEHSESTRGRNWQNKYQQIAVDHPEQNGITTENNPLAGLLGQYDSDSETEDNNKQDSNSNQLNDKVNDFLKEIQMITPDSLKSTESEKSSEVFKCSGGKTETSNCSWQECFDESTGYPYYWHIETNEVTWEMPDEMKILKGKLSQNNQDHSQTQHTHSQVQQWANFLPNTYPELQTNIPEGMIPKEVVARNRNRQVGLAKGHLESEINAQTPKKGGPKDDDSDDEKIEMITSFGNDESDSETSESESPVKEGPPEMYKAQKLGSSVSLEKNPDLKDEGSVSIGPSLPPGIIPMIHGPENASLEMRSEMASLQMEKREANSTTAIEAAAKTEDIDEEDILKRLKNQAKLLQLLGGEVPESVETFIKNDDVDENEDEDDIISQIEKEMPLDYAVDLQNGNKREFITENNDSKIRIVDENEKRMKNRSKEFKISLVAGYSDDSEPEEELSPQKISSQPLFPISEYIVRDNSSSLIKGDLDTINENKDLFQSDVSTGTLEMKRDEENKEEARKISEEDSITNENLTQSTINGPDSFEMQQNKIVKIENEPARQHPFFENLEIPNKAFQRKKRIAFDVVPNKTMRPQSESTTTNSAISEASTSGFSGSLSHDDVERLGFGFRKDQQSDLDGTESFGSEIIEKPRAGDKDSTAQLKKPISFVKGEISGMKKPEDDEKPKKREFESEKPDPQTDGTKKLKELTDVVMEKIKFLSEGSQSLSAIQIMVIQLQTLVAAWEAGDLRENYLYEWLKGTELELGRLEDAAAPPGWDCHWDRSHKRYYYRNSVTGDAQWTYPEADVVGGTEEMDLCTTPPPPEDEELQIIEEQARMNGSTEKPKDLKSPLPIIGDNKIVQVTKDEYKSLEAPPPPQISNPSPPPPPRIFAEDLKKGKKRRGSNSERISDSKKEKTELNAAAFSEAKESVDPPLPPSPPKNTSQPPLPPTPPHIAIIPNASNCEPLPPGVDPKDMPYTLPAVTNMEPGIVYTRTTQQTNPIYAATIGDRAAITLPIIDHRSSIIQGQLMHYPTYQHLHNQAMIAAAGTLGGHEAVRFMLTDYAQVYANTQVIAKPPVKKSHHDQSLGSALDSFYNDIAFLEKTNVVEQESSASQEFDATINSQDTNTGPPQISTLPPPTTTIVTSNNPTTDLEDKTNASILDPSAGREKKKKKAKVGIGKKQKEMSTMVAKWQKAQQDFDDSE